ncbi:hypothetical protein [Prochlorococcus sp. MIT 1300]|uniref:hypothetical protein n=1 Tax=Prochlorococcus sp. MIT 1300 TaxID=3096218 RepID=UPI002A754699|nr:hypothetical protein [Prochlorococcus sp. MIT 1300]
MKTKVVLSASFPLVPLVLAGSFLVNPLLAIAGNYEAVCLFPKEDSSQRKFGHDPRKGSKKKCIDKVVINSETITTPHASIPTTRIISWGIAGESKTDVGGGVATTIILGPIGLLGFLSKKHDYNFAVNGYDADGKRASILMQFKDAKQPKRLMSEMAMLTGLPMGQKRSIKEIRKLEKSGGSLEPENIGRMRSADNLDSGKDPDSLYESSSDKKKCFLGWCRQ